jgi:ABC-type phosphate transport system substrate-binding protein
MEPRTTSEGASSRRRSITTLTRGALALALAFAFAWRAETAGGFKVVVHPENPIVSLAAKEVSRIFFKGNTRWEHGERIMPADQSASSQVRRDFSLAVHEMTLDAVMAYWQQEIFSGRAVPPPVKPDDHAMLEFVRSNPGAIGYVSAAVPAEGVKELTLE